jgi:hypothetical protein
MDRWTGHQYRSGVRGEAAALLLCTTISLTGHIVAHVHIKESDGSSQVLWAPPNEYSHSETCSIRPKSLSGCS